MKRSEKWYFKLKHHCLGNEYLTVEQFEVLTGLSEAEIESFFKESRSQIRQFLLRLGKIVRYQKSKQAEISSDWSTLRHELGQRVCLYSDSIGIHKVSQEGHDLEYGLALLANVDRRKAVTWAIRLKKKLPDFAIDVTSLPRLAILLNQINQD
ncbi:hypothetical protein ABF107_002592 [Vibrio parahaemolyticus]|nr:hypothetical protein [Vibrio parahaemolyticus]